MWYSTFDVDHDTTTCFFVLHNIKDGPRNMQYSIADHLVSRQVAQSALASSLNWILEEARKKSPCPKVPFACWRTLIVACIRALHGLGTNWLNLFTTKHSSALEIIKYNNLPTSLLYYEGSSIRSPFSWDNFVFGSMGTKAYLHPNNPASKSISIAYFLYEMCLRSPLRLVVCVLLQLIELYALL